MMFQQFQPWLGFQGVIKGEDKGLGLLIGFNLMQILLNPINHPLQMDFQHQDPNLLHNKRHFLLPHQASQVASHAANTAEFYQREAMQVREVAQAEISNARQTIHSIVAQAKAFM